MKNIISVFKKLVLLMLVSVMIISSGTHVNVLSAEDSEFIELTEEDIVEATAKTPFEYTEADYEMDLQSSSREADVSIQSLSTTQRDNVLKWMMDRAGKNTSVGGMCAYAVYRAMDESGMTSAQVCKDPVPTIASPFCWTDYKRFKYIEENGSLNYKCQAFTWKDFSERRYAPRKGDLVFYDTSHSSSNLTVAQEAGRGKNGHSGTHVGMLRSEDCSTSTLYTVDGGQTYNGSGSETYIKEKVRSMNSSTGYNSSSLGYATVFVRPCYNASYDLYCYNNYSGKNYIVDSDFTTLNTDRYRSRDASVNVISVDSSVKHNGYNSLKVENYSEGSSGKDFDIITTTMGANNHSGEWVGDDWKYYMFSFYAKGNKTGAKFYVRWGYESNYSGGVEITTEWKKYTIRMDKRVTFDGCLHAYLDSPGTVWLTEIQLEDGLTVTDFVPEHEGLYGTTSNSYNINTTYYSLPSTPTRSGYTFDGWYTQRQDGTKITSSTQVMNGTLNVFAHWTKNPDVTMTVYFNANGGSVSTSSKTVTQGSTYGTLPTPTWSGHTFDGWYTSATGGSRVTSSTTVTQSSNHTLYAHWTENPVTMTVYFDPNGGSVSTSSKTVTKGSTYGTLPTPVWNDHTFDGWYTSVSGGSKVTSSTTVMQSSSHTLYAHWTENIPSLVVGRITDNDIQQESLNVAKQLKKELGISQFSNVIIATDADFADALSGSYLAARKNAPILYISGSSFSKVYEYLDSNLVTNGTVYILGDENAVPVEFESGLNSSFRVRRLAGSSRFLTNLEILKEAGMTSSGDIVVVTGSGYADSLSAGALGIPILMVNNGDTKLKNSQTKFLQQNVSGKVYILGDTNAVNSSLEKALKTYGPVTRIGGSSRWETTKLIAEKFVPSATSVVLATGNDFRDGLIASPLAYAMHAPLLLAASDKTYQAKLYVQNRNITNVRVVGTYSRFNDEAIQKIFPDYNVTVVIMN